MAKEMQSNPNAGCKTKTERAEIKKTRDDTVRQTMFGCVTPPATPPPYYIFVLSLYTTCAAVSAPSTKERERKKKHTKKTRTDISKHTL